MNRIIPINIVGEPKPSSDFFKKTVEKVENIHQTIVDLFGSSSAEDGLFSYRSSTLHQFAVLSSAYHQNNTIDFLSNSDSMKNIFSHEIGIALYRTKDDEHNAIKTINENMVNLEKYLSNLYDLLDDLEELENTSLDYTREIDHSYYENALQSLIFYLQEIKSRVVLPASNILNAEINASNKLIKIITSRHTTLKEISSEEIARMSEIMSWGLETPPGWKSIQSDTSELSNDLEKKLGSLKAFVTSNFSH